MSPAFEIAFFLLMAGFPVGFVSHALRGEGRIPGCDDSHQMETRILPAVRRMWLTTTAAAAVTALVAWLLPTPGPALLIGGMVVFHVVWWPCAFPLLNHGRPGRKGDAAAAPGPDSALDPAPDAASPDEPRRRVASLRDRPRSSYLSPVWWVLPIGVFTITLAEIVRAVVTGPTLPSSGATLHLVLEPLGAVGILIGYGWWAHHSAGTPQDLSQADDPAALEAAYDDFRRFIVRGVFALMTAMVLLLMGSAVAVAHAPASGFSGATLGMLGGVGGTVVGLAGAAFGTLADVKRLRIRKLKGTAPA